MDNRIGLKKKNLKFFLFFFFSRKIRFCTRFLILDFFRQVMAIKVLPKTVGKREFGSASWIRGISK